MNKKGSKHRKFDEDAFYKKYKHVVPGSIKKVKPESVVNGCNAVHGRICKIKCKETGKLRTINVQDAFQTFYITEVQKRKQLERAAEQRRKNKNKS